MTRAQQLVAAVADELRDGIPPLSHDFCDRWGVTGDEYELLCEFLASGAEALSKDVFRPVVPA